LRDRARNLAKARELTLAERIDFAERRLRSLERKLHVGLADPITEYYAAGDVLVHSYEREVRGLARELDLTWSHESGFSAR
jgi:hypothetical protein